MTTPAEPMTTAEGWMLVIVVYGALLYLAAIAIELFVKAARVVLMYVLIRWFDAMAAIRRRRRRDDR